MKIKEISSYLMERFPLENASDFDNGKLGFVIGDDERELTGILLCLDLTTETLNEAIEKKCNLIVTHHPFLFFPTHKVLLNTEKGSIINKMMKNDISLYSMHTNLDVGEGGVNDSLCKILGLKNVEGVVAKDAFLRTGVMKPMMLKDFAKEVMEKFHLSGCKTTGDPNKLVSKVGIVGGGSGSAMSIMNALNAGVDVYIGGEMRLDAVQVAYYEGLSIIEVNHGVEKLVFNYLKPDLDKLVNNKVNVYISDVNTDPLTYHTLEA